MARRQKLPLPGRSCSATVSDAKYSGSRAAFAIIEPAQVSHGMNSLPSSVMKPPWQSLQLAADSKAAPPASPPGAVPAAVAVRAAADAKTAVSKMLRNPIHLARAAQ